MEKVIASRINHNLLFIPQCIICKLEKRSNGAEKKYIIRHKSFKLEYIKYTSSLKILIRQNLYFYLISEILYIKSNDTAIVYEMILII